MPPLWHDVELIGFLFGRMLNCVPLSQDDSVSFWEDVELIVFLLFSMKWNLSCSSFAAECGIYCVPLWQDVELVVIFFGRMLN